MHTNDDVLLDHTFVFAPTGADGHAVVMQQLTAMALEIQQGQKSKVRIMLSCPMGPAPLAWEGALLQNHSELTEWVPPVLWLQPKSAVILDGCRRG